MPLVFGLPLLFLIALVFIGVVGVFFLLDRGRESRPGARLESYVNLSPSLEASIETLVDRRREQSSGFDRLLGYAAILASQKLRATAANDLSRARIEMNPNVFLGIRGVLLVGVPLIGLLWVL